MSSPLQQVLFSKACQLLNIGCNYVPTVVPGPTWGELTVQFFFFTFFTWATHTSIPCLMDKTSRGAVLLALLVSSFSSLYLSLIFPMISPVLYNGVVTDFTDTLMRSCPIFIFLLFVSLLIMFRSSFKFPISYCVRFITANFIFLVFLLVVNDFPLFTKSDYDTITFTIITVIIVSAYLSLSINNFYCFVKILFADKLFLKDGGCLVKKGTEWVEAQEDDDTANLIIV